jgi:hypothetical protein
VIDGQEPNPTVEDTDGDGKINALDPDSDGDGLFDGTELGFDCSNAATDAAAGNCVPDADGGATTTDPLDADTDGGSVNDGVEDANHNGAVDAGELDPNNGADDVAAPPAEDDGLFPEGNGILCSMGTGPRGHVELRARRAARGSRAGLRAPPQPQGRLKLPPHDG